MACRCDGYEDMTLRENRAEIDRLTQWVCYLMSELEYEHVAFAIPTDLDEWYRKHKEADEIRKKIEKETLRKQALSKLSEAERKALGV